MRLRGDVTIGFDPNSIAADAMEFAWGVIRSASGLADVGVDPITEGGANWLAYGIATISTQVGGANAERGGLSFKRWDVDSKAMRKLRENESLYFISTTVDIVGAPVTDQFFSLRALTGR